MNTDCKCFICRKPTTAGMKLCDICLFPIIGIPLIAAFSAFVIWIVAKAAPLSSKTTDTVYKITFILEGVCAILFLAVRVYLARGFPGASWANSILNRVSAGFQRILSLISEFFSRQQRDCYICKKSTSSRTRLCEPCMFISFPLILGLLLFSLSLFSSGFSPDPKTGQVWLYAIPTVPFIVLCARSIIKRGSLVASRRVVIFLCTLFIPVASLSWCCSHLDNISKRRDATEIAEGSQFIEKISQAISVAREGPSGGPKKTYPKHSLVVCKVTEKLDWADKAQRMYHYGCPNEWLATTKNQVKLVVLVKSEKRDVIGRYSVTGSTAYSKEWSVTCVDLELEHVIARGTISKTDPSRRPSIGSDDSWDPPSRWEVESEIGKLVGFEE